MIRILFEIKKTVTEKPWQNMLHKIQELPYFSKFVTEVLIFSRSQMFFKIGVLKNFLIFIRKHLCWPLQAFFYRTPTVPASGFLRQQILFFS